MQSQSKSTMLELQKLAEKIAHDFPFAQGVNLYIPVVRSSAPISSQARSTAE